MGQANIALGVQLDRYQNERDDDWHCEGGDAGVKPIRDGRKE